MSSCDEQVLALDELDAHLLGEERVLEVGRVVDARRQHHDGRLARAPAGATLSQRLEQQVRVVLDRRDAVRANSSGNSRIIISRFSSM